MAGTSDSSTNSNQRRKQTLIEASEMLAWNCYRVYESIRTHLDSSEFTWQAPWPRIQPTNVVWTDERIASSLYILKETRKAQDLMNCAARDYISQQKRAQKKQKTGATDDRKEEEEEVEEEEEFSCTCAFQQLNRYLGHDRKAVRQLDIMTKACTAAHDMYLHNFFIREEYTVVFEAYRYIAVVIHREDIAERVDVIFDRLESGRSCLAEPHEAKRLRHIKERKALLASMQQQEKTEK